MGTSKVLAEMSMPMKLRLVSLLLLLLLLLLRFMMQLLYLRHAEFGLIMLAGSPTSNFLSQSTLQTCLARSNYLFCIAVGARDTLRR